MAVDSHNADPIEVHTLTKVETPRDASQEEPRVPPHLEEMLSPPNSAEGRNK